MLRINNFIGKPARLWKTPVDIIKISVKFCTTLFMRYIHISHPVTTCAAPPRSPPMLASRGKPEESALPPSLVCKLQRGSERRAGLPQPPRQWAPFVRPNPSRRTDDGRFCWLKACWSWQNVRAVHERHLSMVYHSRERIVHICRFPWKITNVQLWFEHLMSLKKLNVGTFCVQKSTDGQMNWSTKENVNSM